MDKTLEAPAGWDHVSGGDENWEPVPFSDMGDPVYLTIPDGAPID